MITCPECGQQAPDGTKFCDRCGQGLTAPAASPPPPTRPAPLAAGAKLTHGFEIVELVGQTSIENRYRARREREGKTETLLLRERFSPNPQEMEGDAASGEPSPASEPKALEDPSGPTAKTAELKPLPAAEPLKTANGTSPDGNSSAPAQPSPAGGIQEASPEPQSTEASAAEGLVALSEATAIDREVIEEKAEEAVLEEPAPEPEDLGEVFGRVFALSMTLAHPAFQRALEGFAEAGRIYLAYTDEELKPVHRAGKPMSEPEAISAMIQVCQAIAFAHRRGLRLNDICPESVARARDGRIKLTGLDYVSNDNELQSEPIFNDGYTAPEIYRGKTTDKRADVFSAAALLYTWLSNERIPSESWREEAGPIRFYPPHVIHPELEQVIRHALSFEPKERWPTIDKFKDELIRLLNTVRLRAAAVTDVGMIREHNEDSLLVVEYVRDSLIEPAQRGLYV